MAYKPGLVPTGELPATQRWLRTELQRISQATVLLEEDIQNIPAGGGARVLLETIDNLVGGEFDFDNISQLYDDLVLVGEVRGTAASEGDGMRLFFNDDLTEGNYHFQINDASNGTSRFNDTPSVAYIAQIPSAGSPPSSYGLVTIDIRAYAKLFMKSAMSNHVSYVGVGNSTVGQIGLTHRSILDPISRLRVRTDNHPTDLIIGQMRLYGVSNA